MFWMTLAVILGFFIDLLLGDPRFIYHPVCIIGNGIAAGEKFLRKIFPNSKSGERAAGTLLAICVVVCSAAVPAVILILLYRLSFAAGFVVETIFCWQLLAAKSLKTESMKVYKELKNGTLDSARKAVGMIVGRDTQSLNEAGISKAAVETVAENTADGIIAPLFYMMIGGAVFGFAYKAVNTLDSMIGYKNDTYRYFGTFAARMDDAANYIPARLSAWLMIASAYFTGFDGPGAARIYKRDRRKHKSPNAAQTESVMAGALNIQLAGDAWYFGKLYKKPTIGDDLRPVEYENIKRANQLLYATALLSLLVFSLVKFLVLWA